MNRLRIWSCLILGFWLAFSLQSLPARATPAQEQEAVAVARAWLALVDAGKYDEAWQATASAMRTAVPKDGFVSQLKGVRGQLGAVTSRNVSSHKLVTSVPGGPAGKYVIVELKTDFAKKKGLTERVTPMLDTDGKWKVSGYYFV